MHPRRGAALLGGQPVRELRLGTPVTAPAPDYGTGENGDPLTFEESAALRRLRLLARSWPATLTLVSMDGGLHVMHTGDPRYGASSNVTRTQVILASIDGIPNDGGGW